MQSRKGQFDSSVTLP
nr:unnamed protein product [Callosobruchus chinensis]